MTISVFLFLFLFIESSDSNKPHEHRGKLSPYQIGKPYVQLEKADSEKLAKGKTVIKSIKTKEGGRGFVGKFVLLMEVAIF